MGLVGVYLSAALLLIALSHALGGELSDRFGRRRVMVVSMWLRTALVLAQALSILLAWPVPAVVGIYMAGGFAGSFFNPAAHSWIADHVPPRERLQAYGFLRVAINLGWALGPAVGGALATRSYPLAFFVSGAACAVCALILTAWVSDRRPAATAESSAFMAALGAARDRRFAAFCACVFLMGLVMAQLVAPLSVYAVTFAGLSEAQVGLLFSINGVIVVAVQSAVSSYCSRHRLTTALAAGCLLYALGYGFMGALRGFPALAAAMAVVSLGEVMVSPGLQALGVNMAPEGMTGRYAGVSGSSLAVGHAAGPLLGGLGLQYLAPGWPALPWLLVGLTAAGAAAGFYSLRRRLSRDEEGLGEAALETAPLQAGG